MDWDKPIIKANQGYLVKIQYLNLKAQKNIPEKQIYVEKENEKTDELESKQLIMRCKDGIFYQNYNEIEQNQRTFICKEKTFCISSKDGNLLICGNDDKLQLFSFLQHQIIAQKQMKFIQDVGFSKSEKFITCVDRLDKDTFIVSIFETTEMKEVLKYTLPAYQKSCWPIAKFIQNDECCFLVNDLKTLVEYETKTWTQKSKIKVQFKLSYFIQFNEMDSFYLTNDLQQNVFIVLLLNQVKQKFIHFQGFEQKHGMFTVYDYKTLVAPKFEKKIEMAQQMIAYLSPDNTILLLLAQNSHDQTNQSYYGQMQLFYYNVKINFILKQIIIYQFNTSVFKQVPTYEGPIHDISWSPNRFTQIDSIYFKSEQFIVISGFMPGYSVLFNKNCEPQFEFGKHHRNSIIWNKQNRFVIIAGFGNLSGDIDVWDAKTFQQVGFCQSKGASFCIFAPDGRKFLTACVTPRLRVNNHYQVFHYNGQKQIFFNYNHSELYDVIWRPEKNIIYQDRPASPKGLQAYEESKKEVKPKRMFQPKGCKLAEQLKAEKQQQGARKLNSNETFGNQLVADKPKQNYPPGYVPDEDDKPKKKKKKNKKKQAEQQQAN